MFDDNVSFEAWFAVPDRVACAAVLGLFKQADATSPDLVGPPILPTPVGPNPVVASILGGLAGAGLGGLAGHIGERLAPRGTFRKGRLTQTSALVGGMLGALPGAYLGSVSARQHGATLPYALTTGWPITKSALDEIAETMAETSDVDPAYRAMTDKIAFDTGAMYAQTIPVDAFNQAIWADVNHPANPFGTKSPWGNNEQSLYTPIPIAAAASGFVAGAGAATNSSHVSPWSVGLTAASSAGKGYLAAMGVAKVFGALAGLSPEGQSKLRQAGTWAGLITGTVRSLFE
jgi:hypothetical protein